MNSEPKKQVEKVCVCGGNPTYTYHGHECCSNSTTVVIKSLSALAESAAKDAELETLRARVEELDRWKREAMVAMRESEEWRSKFNDEAVVMGYAGKHYLESAYLIAVRCKSAESRLRAVSEALEKLPDRFAEPIRSRLRAMMGEIL